MIDNLKMPDGHRIPEPQAYKHVGSMIRAFRLKCKISQDDLAKRIGHTRTSITNMEAGRQRIPIDVLIAISRSLRIELSDLLPHRALTLPAEVGKKVPKNYDAAQMNALQKVVSRK